MITVPNRDKKIKIKHKIYLRVITHFSDGQFLTAQVKYLLLTKVWKLFNLCYQIVFSFNYEN